MIFRGVVQRGAKRGTSLGFPTANIQLHDAQVSGVYAGSVTIGDQKYRAAVYADRKRKLLEAHVLDFSGDLYEQSITIELFEKIRDDKRFENDTELISAIAEDVGAIREYFKK